MGERMAVEELQVLHDGKTIEVLVGERFCFEGAEDSFSYNGCEGENYPVRFQRHTIRGEVIPMIFSKYQKEKSYRFANIKGWTKFWALFDDCIFLAYHLGVKDGKTSKNLDETLTEEEARRESPIQSIPRC